MPGVMTGVHEVLSRQEHQERGEGTGNNVDYKKLLRDVIRGGFIESEHIALPMGGPISPDDAHDELCEILSSEEMLAYAQLVREIKAEAIAAGETRVGMLREFDKAIAECEVEAGADLSP
jgi:hypothetical protein